MKYAETERAQEERTNLVNRYQTFFNSCDGLQNLSENTSNTHQPNMHLWGKHYWHGAFREQQRNLFQTFSHVICFKVKNRTKKKQNWCFKKGTRRREEWNILKSIYKSLGSCKKQTREMHRCNLVCRVRELENDKMSETVTRWDLSSSVTANKKAVWDYSRGCGLARAPPSQTWSQNTFCLLTSRISRGSP